MNPFRKAFVFFAVYRDGAVVAVQSNPLPMADDSGSNDTTLIFDGVFTAPGGGGTPVSGFSWVNGALSSEGLLRAASVSATHWAANAQLYARFSLLDSSDASFLNAWDTPIFLRTIEHIEFFFLRNGSSTPQTIPGALPSGTGYDFTEFTWSASPLGGLAGATVGFNHADSGRTTDFTLTGNPMSGWSQDEAELDLTITSEAPANAYNVCTAEFEGLSWDGTNTPNDAAQPRVWLRRLMADGGDLLGYYWIRGQGSGDGVVNSPLPTDTSAVGVVQDAPHAGAETALGSDCGLGDLGFTPTTPALNHIKVRIDSDTNAFRSGSSAALPLELRSFDIDYDTDYDWLLPYAQDQGAVLNADRTLAVDGGDLFDWSGFTDVFDAGSNIELSSGAFGSNGILVGWQFGETLAGDDGTIDLTLKSVNFSWPASHVQVSVRIDGGGAVQLGVRQLGRTDSNLTGARKKLPYKVEVEAYNYTEGVPGSEVPVTLGPGETLDWEVIDPWPLLFDTYTYDDTVAEPSRNFIETLNDGTAIEHVPDSWTSPQTVRVRVSKHDSDGGLLEGGNEVELNLPVLESKDRFAVAILLDRSGSMSAQNRWNAAVSGARFFCDLLQDVNTDAGTDQHDVAVMWYGGTTGFDNAQAGSPSFGGAQGAGYDLLGPAVDFGNIGNATFLTDYDAAAGSVTPHSATPIGSGMLFARDKLLEAYPDGAGLEHERVVVVLSDGMQNVPPMIEPTVDTHWDVPAGDPQIRMYAAALGTTGTWADVLAYAVGKTGGYPAIDVKHLDAVPDAAAVGMLVQQWFANTFGEIFGGSFLEASPDPELTPGESASHPVEVNYGHSRLVFCLFTGDDAAGWDMGVEPPLGGGVIWHDEPGVTFRDGPMYKLAFVKLPLTQPGEEHRWAGEWMLHVKRTGAGSGKYSYQVRAKTEDLSTVRVVGPALPRENDVIRLQAALTADSKPVDDAKVTALVTKPGPWGDALVGASVKKGLDGPDDKEKEHSHPLQRLALGVSMRPDAEPPETMEVPFSRVGAGVYEARFRADDPGCYSIDTSIAGVRPGDPQLTAVRPHLPALRRRLGPRSFAHVLSALKRSAGAQQQHHVEDRRTVNVRFRPHPRRTNRSGLVLEKGIFKEVHLSVRPINDDGVHLGPGWAREVAFYAPGRRFLKQPTEDGGDGSYSTRIRYTMLHPVVDPRELVIRAAEIHVAPTGDIEDPARFHYHGRLLPLRLFGAKVLGVDIPIEVRPFMPKPLPEGVRPGTSLPMALVALHKALSGGVKPADLGTRGKAELAEVAAGLGVVLGGGVARNARGAQKLRRSIAVGRTALLVALSKLRKPDAGGAHRALADAFEAVDARWPDVGNRGLRAFFEDVDELIEALDAVATWAH